MTDIYDRATELEEQDRERALAEHAKRSAIAGKTVEDSAKFCDDCGIDIPLKRRQAMPGCQRCVTCQQRKELRR
ncbi:TraR/DksA family transcriptional regulator [Undibacterium sp. SXout11W]|uniref:TraR/DksA family transcriptional regulator n=1 Tax=Undibacterium sp. SXout11W TaxID=3413050 RepID=UPI003BF392B7